MKMAIPLMTLSLLVTACGIGTDQTGASEPIDTAGLYAAAVDYARENGHANDVHLVYVAGPSVQQFKEWCTPSVDEDSFRCTSLATERGNG